MKKQMKKRKYTKRSPKWKAVVAKSPDDAVARLHSEYLAGMKAGIKEGKENGASWKPANEWRLAGLYACLGHEGKSALLRSVSIEYGPGNAECVWHDLDGARVGAHCIARCFGPIAEDKE